MAVTADFEVQACRDHLLVSELLTGMISQCDSLEAAGAIADPGLLCNFRHFNGNARYVPRLSRYRNSGSAVGYVVALWCPFLVNDIRPEQVRASPPLPCPWRGARLPHHWDIPNRPSLTTTSGGSICA